MLECGKMIYLARPMYPKEAKKARIEGTVTLDVTITKTGKVSEIHVVSGDPMLVPTTVNAVKQWRFVACPVEQKRTIPVSFSLNQ